MPAAAHRNRRAVGDRVSFDPAIPREVTDAMFDPQTSGGLLIAVPQERGERLLDRLLDAGAEASLIGQVLPAGAKPLKVTQ